MDDKNAEIAVRFEEFGKRICGDKHGWKKKYADKLGVGPNHITDILGVRAPIGGLMQSRLRELGCDIDWLMTGEAKDATQIPKNEIRIHFSGNPSDELRMRFQKLGEWILSHGQDKDSAYIGYVTQKFLEGKILDSEGKEIN